MSADDPGESYTSIIREMYKSGAFKPAPVQPCAVLRCDQPKLKHSLLFCSGHELAWIAHDGTPSARLDHLRAGDAIRWAKNIQI